MARSNDINLFPIRHTLDDNIKRILTNTSAPARPLPYGSFDLDVVVSIVAGPKSSYDIQIGVKVPVWFAAAPTASQ